MLDGVALMQVVDASAVRSRLRCGCGGRWGASQGFMQPDEGAFPDLVGGCGFSKSDNRCE